ncbi:sodium- and chloride-dependent GABA transporter 2-like isoform X2 [Clavelina lepadiformis]|uniref:sodium- and chloride-dependent GABA transporter 2-like isoform X2 n=1 Tax=Clavelina lepadiformis TaxID=159417 RepID=UPI00404329A8
MFCHKPSSHCHLVLFCLYVISCIGGRFSKQDNYCNFSNTKTNFVGSMNADKKDVCEIEIRPLAGPKKDVSEPVSTSKRQTWDNKREFVLAMIGYSVGYGNVWRFPYLCYKNGGGAFLLPYILFVIIGGIPMFFLEVSLGQFTQMSAVEIWRLVPSMKGIGYGCTFVNLIFCFYYVLVMAWSMLYLIHSCLPGPLPWTTCDNWWNSGICVANSNTSATNDSAPNITSFNSTSPETEFWRNYVIRQSSGIDEIGSLENWPIILCFLGSWILIYLCVFKGVKSGGKVVYFTATFPYLMLIVVLIRGLTLEGAMTGIKYLLKPDFSKLLQPQVWVDAGSQIFFSYGICFTVMITFGSYNRFHNNCYRQSVILASSCSLTSLLASFVVFSILGHMSVTQSKNIAEVATQGPGLAFLVYPTGLSLLPAPRFWSILFFATLLVVGIDTQFASVEGAVSTIVDSWPWLERGKFGREKVTAVLCVIFFLLGLPLLTNGGLYIFELYNMYAASGISLLSLAFFEAVTIGWIYGVNRYFDNIKEMIGYYPSAYIKICLRYLIPILSLCILIFFCVMYKPLVLNGYEYPTWANAIGWLMSLASILCVPGFFLLNLCKGNGTIYERLASALHARSLPVTRIRNLLVYRYTTRLGLAQATAKTQLELSNDIHQYKYTNAYPFTQHYHNTDES